MRCKMCILLAINDECESREYFSETASGCAEAKLVGLQGLLHVLRQSQECLDVSRKSVS
jgi:hypothetical protein